MKPSEKPRPTPVLVLAVLHFVAAGLGTCNWAVPLVESAGAAAVAPRPSPGLQVEREMGYTLQTQIPGWRLYRVAELVKDMLLSCLLAVSGVGLLRLAPWGRRTSIVYAWLSLAHKGLALLYLTVFALPVAPGLFEKVLEDATPPADPTALSPQLGAAVLTGELLGLPVLLAIYPIVVLVILYRPAVRRAFAAASTSAVQKEL